MLDFDSDIENLEGEYLVQHILQIQGILLQYLEFNKQIFPLQIFYIIFKIYHNIVRRDLSGRFRQLLSSFYLWEN